MSEVLTFDEACAVLRVAPPTVYNWRERGYGPPFFKYIEARSSPLFILRKDLDAWITQQATKTAS